MEPTRSAGKNYSPMLMIDLNLILSHSCPVRKIDNVTSVHYIDVHCVRFIVTAKLLTVLPTITYEILEFSMEDL